MGVQQLSLGKVTVVTAGTPVQVDLTVLPADNRQSPRVHAYIVQALSANVGKVYIGTLGMNKSTLAGVLAVLPIPTANLVPTLSVSVAQAANGLNLSDLWFDADTSGEGVLVSCLVC